jgi:hypothetical protein
LKSNIPEMLAHNFPCTANTLNKRFWPLLPKSA